MSFIHKKVKVLLCHLGVWLVCSSAWPLPVFHSDKPFLRGRWWQISCWIILFPKELFNVPTGLYITQWQETSCQSSVFSKKDFHQLEGLQSLRKLIGQYSQEKEKVNHFQLHSSRTKPDNFVASPQCSQR